MTGSAHARIDELIAHHDRRLDASAAVIKAGASTAYEAARALRWTRRERPFDDLDPFNQMMAVMETAAHLDVLVRQGRLRSPAWAAQPVRPANPVLVGTSSGTRPDLIRSSKGTGWGGLDGSWPPRPGRAAGQGLAAGWRARAGRPRSAW